MCTACDEWEHKLADIGQQYDDPDDTDPVFDLTGYDTLQQQLC